MPAAAASDPSLRRPGGMPRPDTAEFTVSADRRIITAGPELGRLLEVDPGSLLARDAVDLFHRESRTAFLSEHSGLVSGARSRLRREIRLEAGRGEGRWALLTGRPTATDASGRPTQIHYGVLAFPEQGRGIREGRPRGSRPTPTGASAAQLLELTGRVSDRIPRQGQYAAVILGSSPRLAGRGRCEGAGCDVVDVLTSTLRAGDIVVRTGGDEVAVLLDGLRDMAAADLLAEVVAVGLGACSPALGESRSPAVSVGIAMALPGADPLRMLEEAAAALSEAQAGQGDRACTHLLVGGRGAVHRVVALAPTGPTSARRPALGANRGHDLAHRVRDEVREGPCASA